MNKNLLKLFSMAALFFTVSEQRCSNTRDYLELIPRGKIRSSLEKNPADSGARFIAHLFCSAIKGNLTESGTKCLDNQKYFKFMPKGKIKESCEKNPADPGARFVAGLFRSRTGENESQMHDLVTFWEAKEDALEQEKQGLPISDFHVFRGEE